ncbi:ABC transporter ATP-binding protein [Rhizobium deserti]|uniref:ABC transporter ATP-binding protein n=1 Tax=Rhizobium deserti TaxID=2547961 RepID=A0A4R5UND9_9HYPH|nr:ABC transporter ATP-binding protein [Rhizobium deserti]TDK39416.1 ABC transporter ATP-binding protein [Rhizobium deserti]
MTLLQLNFLNKHFGAVAALDGVHLTATSGSRTAIVGPSGCGKTTLLRLIAGFETPDAGEILLDGHRIADADAQVPAHLRNIGIVAQDGCLFPHLSVVDNIGFGLKAERAVKLARASELLDMVGLDQAMLARKPDQLSGGQQQRVALARALARKPRLMLLDEPFSALDTGLRAATRKAVTEVLSTAGITTILVTHDQGEALAFADQLAVMRGGRFVQVGHPREVYERPVDAATAVFLGEAVLLPAVVTAGRAQTPLGVLAVEDLEFRGQTTVLLRPEQISVRRVEGGEGDGVITDLVFGGSTCNVCLTLGGTEAFSFRIDVPSRDIRSAGDRVAIGVDGPAHIFP